MSTLCFEVPLTCGANNLDNSTCSFVYPYQYSGDRCNEHCSNSSGNQVHYAFVTNGSPFTIIINYANCINIGYADKLGIDFGISTECCGGTTVSCHKLRPPTYQTSFTVTGAVPCKIYWIDISWILWFNLRLYYKCYGWSSSGSIGIEKYK
ncbi:MAG: hypothetical protein IPM34_06615 [Saprospiraceae bacterium]|nr:hypothetical protein [Saprospiraceae bacterium]